MNKTKSTLAILSLAAATAFAGSALAQVTQETGAYAGLSLGQSKAKLDCAGFSSCDDKDTAFKIFGGYQFMRYIAAEAGYTDLGKVKASAPGVSVEIKSHVWELLAVGSYPIGTSGFAPYAKAGFYRGETKTNVSVTGGGASNKETSTDITGGIGVRYDIMRNFAVRAEWQRYNKVKAGTLVGVNIGDSNVDVISIGGIYKF